MEKRSLVRGSALLVLFIMSAAGIFGGGPAWAAAEAGESTEFAQYLPLILTTGCIPGPIIEPDDPDRDTAVEEEINAIRVDRGLPILVDALKITQAALRHSNDMADNNFFSHTGSDGSSAGQRMEQACYNWQAYGEIIAAGFRDPGKVIEVWMNSPGHRSIILSDVYAEFGTGYAYNSSSKYKHYWTVDFGLRAEKFNSNAERFYLCEYYLQDEAGESWLKLYSAYPCEQALEKSTGVDEQR